MEREEMTGPCTDFKTWICMRAAEMTGSAGNRL